MGIKAWVPAHPPPSQLRPVSFWGPVVWSQDVRRLWQLQACGHSVLPLTTGASGSSSTFPDSDFYSGQGPTHCLQPQAHPLMALAPEAPSPAWGRAHWGPLCTLDGGPCVSPNFFFGGGE